MAPGATGHEASPVDAKFERHGGDLRLLFRGWELGLDCDSDVLAVTAKTIKGLTVARATRIESSKCK